MTNEPKDLIQTCLDVYNMIGKPKEIQENLKNIPIYITDYNKDFGISSLSIKHLQLKLPQLLDPSNEHFSS